MQGFSGVTRRHRVRTIAGRPVFDDHLYAQPIGAVEVDRGPPRRALFAARVMEGLAVLTVALILVVLAVGCGPVDVEVTAEAIAQADARKEETRLGIPLGFGATVRDCLPDRTECSEVRYYIPKSAR